MLNLFLLLPVTLANISPLFPGNVSAVYTRDGIQVHVLVRIVLGGGLFLLPSSLRLSSQADTPWSLAGCLLGCCGHCPQNSRDVLFFLCEWVLSGPQISLHLFEKQCHLSEELFTQRLWSDWIIFQVTSLWSLVVRKVLWKRKPHFLCLEISVLQRNHPYIGNTKQWKESKS